MFHPKSFSSINATGKNLDTECGPTTKTNLFQAVNQALRTALRTDPKVCVFGEDVGFGGVFRCAMDLREEFGSERVFNTPISEQGIAGVAIGMAALGHTPVAEFQFADYIFPAFDQIINEAAKFRYRSGGAWDCGGCTFRTAAGAVGHGGLYHSQSPEAYFAHTPGLKIVTPRGAAQAKGLLLACIRDRNPCLFLEPKCLYRASVDQVPETDYVLDLSKAEIVQHGTQATVVAWGAQVGRLLQANKVLKNEHNLSLEIIDLQTILPWDTETVIESVKKTGRLIVTHEAPQTMGMAAEIIATVHEQAFFSMEAPPLRICGYDTPFPLAGEQFYIPNQHRLVDEISRAMKA